MAIIILLTRNQLIYRIHGKTNSNYTFTTIIRLYICFNFFFLFCYIIIVCTILDIAKYKQNVSTFVAETFESTENSVN